MNVSGCMFCKHAEGNKINQKKKKIYIKCCVVEKGNKFKDLQLRVVSELQGCCISVSLAGSVEENLRSLRDKNYKLINEKS
jgi:hypothetical protein